MSTTTTDSFIKMARDRGLKVTPQRIQIFNALAEKHGHLSAEEIHLEVRQTLPAVSLDTVYRTLATLADHGLIDRVYSDDVRTRFEMHRHPHHHFICIKCKNIMDVEWPEFDRLKYPDTITRLGTSIVSRIELRGVCESCAKAEAKGARKNVA